MLPLDLGGKKPKNLTTKIFFKEFHYELKHENMENRNCQTFYSNLEWKKAFDYFNWSISKFFYLLNPMVAFIIP